MTERSEEDIYVSIAVSYSAGSGISLSQGRSTLESIIRTNGFAVNVESYNGDPPGDLSAIPVERAALFYFATIVDLKGDRCIAGAAGYADGIDIAFACAQSLSYAEVRTSAVSRLLSETWDAFSPCRLVFCVGDSLSKQCICRRAT